MKKLLSILTITTLTASIPAPLLANTVQNRVKRDVGSLTSNSNNDYLPFIKLNGIIGSIYRIAVESKDNIYFGTDIGAFVLKQGETTPTKINGISGDIATILVDSKDNIYFSTTGGAFVLKNGSTTPTKINEIKGNITSIAVDSKDNIYYGTDIGAFVLKHGATTPTKINGISNNIQSITIDSNDNIYFGTDKGAFILQNALSWVKTNINVNLVDKTKNLVWLRDDQLVANGQVKVIIANNAIETVKINGAIMPSPDKNWDFDFPPTPINGEPIPKANFDYKIEIAFTLDGKSYTGQIIVSVLLAQPSITVQKNTSLFGHVDSYNYQVPTNDKVGDINLTSDLYYSDTEVKVSLNQPTGSTVQSGVVYGLNDKWQKNGQKLDITGNVSLNATMLNSYQGRFLVETKDSVGNKSNYYIVIWKNNLTPNFWNTDQGQYFYSWASLNGYNECIKKLNAIELNKIINESKNWQQLASDSQFAKAVADWFKNNAKLSSKEPLTKEQVIEQLKTQIPSSIKIPAVNTSNYDVNKVSFVLNQTEFNPNDKVNIVVKYNNAKADLFTLQIKDSSTPDNNKKTGLGIWTIFGIVVGSLVGLALLGWLFKRFVINPFILKPIREKREKAFATKTEKDIAQMKKDDEEWEAKQKGDK